jgi:hypothetical protein
MGKEFCVIAFIVHVCGFAAIVVKTVNMDEIKILGNIFGTEFSSRTICAQPVKSVIHMKDIGTPELLKFFLLLLSKLRHFLHGRKLHLTIQAHDRGITEGIQTGPAFIEFSGDQCI